MSEDQVVGWQAGPRPEWVSAVNDGQVPPIAEEAALPLQRDSLLSEARARLAIADGGMADFGDEAFLEPLDIFLEAIEKEAELHLTGRWLTRRFLLRLLEVRLQLIAYLRADPGVVEEVIGEPLFVTGAPRTGTTILYALLAEEPGLRAPLGWELLRPLPPPDPATFDQDPRIGLADRELRLPAEVVDSLDAIHEYGGRLPKECLSAMSFELRSEEFTARYHVPTYTAWLDRCDMRPAYEMHRLVLQILQRRSKGRQWVLKSPVHLHSLPVLRRIYPDASIAITHRDPLAVLGSATSLIATLRWAHSDHVDFQEIGRYHAGRYQADLDRLVTWSEDGTLGGDRVRHVQYDRFLADPMGAVRKLYGDLGRPLEPPAQGAMEAQLRSQRQGRHGAHRYSFDALGLDMDEQRAGFARYQEYFGVASELGAS